MRTVFVNPERCIGCRQCEIACAVEHSQSKNLYQAILEKPKARSRIHVAPGLYLSTSFPNKCRHCDPAPCMSVCPTGAISRDAELGTVVVDGKSASPAPCVPWSVRLTCSHSTHRPRSSWTRRWRSSAIIASIANARARTRPVSKLARSAPWSLATSTNWSRMPVCVWPGPYRWPWVKCNLKWLVSLPT